VTEVKDKAPKAIEGDAPDEGAIAVEEVAEEKPLKTAKIGELELDLPDELPPAIIFDLVELEASGDDPMPVMRTLRSMLGSEQFIALRHHVEANDVGDLNGLLDLIFGQYGVKLGE
jgi:hypothetical protein